MKARYFASVRERIGLAEEEVAPPSEVSTVGELIAWLCGRGEGYALALADAAKVRVALDQTHARLDSPIGQAREVAFFPPMTGG
ncbi:molybdopterin converting factor subunit 1 [Methylocystis bryophila]|uniref:Molybdopterin converting factor subunit 1 n=1 Tax=Methylocystis bryophila TaxID=655015 RepID=A0A1W6MSQ8_9HYPH|nr:molybdopterin converting factor subunit 1 [Methylocystis bryophila]ARN80607.1 molybdopterin converting factor subunit 1 [Methylocystis bryophila]BDV40661.1 molybdopterin synthase sulfur carrier subunit [Methylocystis bryophila]